MDLFEPFSASSAPFNGGNWIAAMAYMPSSKQRQLMMNAYKNSMTGLDPVSVNEIFEYYYKNGEYLDDPGEKITPDVSKDIIKELQEAVEGSDDEAYD